MATRPKRPRDPFQLAKLIGDISTGQITDAPPKIKDPRAVALSLLGASKGGIARKKSLSVKRRKQIAKAAAQARWAKK